MSVMFLHAFLAPENISCQKRVFFLALFQKLARRFLFSSSFPFDRGDPGSAPLLAKNRKAHIKRNRDRPRKEADRKAQKEPSQQQGAKTTLVTKRRSEEARQRPTGRQPYFFIVLRERLEVCRARRPRAERTRAARDKRLGPGARWVLHARRRGGGSHLLARGPRNTRPAGPRSPWAAPLASR